jgi:ABC-type Fe3+ transport system permease subunit
MDITATLLYSFVAFLIVLVVGWLQRKASGDGKSQQAPVPGMREESAVLIRELGTRADCSVLCVCVCVLLLCLVVCVTVRCGDRPV